jgi:hypothetical protein
MDSTSLDIFVKEFENFGWGRLNCFFPQILNISYVICRKRVLGTYEMQGGKHTNTTQGTCAKSFGKLLTTSFNSRKVRFMVSRICVDHKWTFHNCPKKLVIQKDFFWGKIWCILNNIWRQKHLFRGMFMCHGNWN